jgi:hypothetical protein
MGRLVDRGLIPRESRLSALTPQGRAKAIELGILDVGDVLVPAAKGAA